MSHRQCCCQDHPLALSDIFHTLSQPLTALRYALDVSLIDAFTVDQYRQAVQAAIEQAERLQEALVEIRDARPKHRGQRIGWNPDAR